MLEINLLKTEPKEIQKAADFPDMETGEKRKRPPLQFNYSLIFLVAIIGIAALYFTQKSATSKEMELLRTAEQEKAQLQDVVKTLNELEQTRALYEKKIDLITQLKAKQGAAVNVMDQMSRNLPDWVWLTEASMSGSAVRIKGRAINNTLIADYISNLEQSHYFTNINLSNSTQRSTGGRRYYEFTMSARYVHPQPENTESTQPAEGEQK